MALDDLETPVDTPTGRVLEGHHTVLRRLAVTAGVLRRGLLAGIRGGIGRSARSDITVGTDAALIDRQTTLSLDKRLDDSSFRSTSMISAESCAHRVR